MPGTTAGGPEQRPEDAVLRGAGLPAAVVAVVVVAVCAAWGGRAAAGAAVGAALTLATFALGPALLRTSSRWSPPAVMVVAVSAYATSVVLLGVAFLALRDAAWLSPVTVGVAIFVVSTAWMAGHVRAAGRLRVLAFGSPPGPSADRDVAGHGGTAASPGPTSH